MPLNIPFSSIVDWCQFHDLPGSEVPVYDTCIRRMDDAFKEWHHQKTKQANRGRG
jgi:hypothetical protein